MEKYNDPGLKQFLWKKCKSIPGKNPNIWRYDRMGYVCHYEDARIDHKVSQANGGNDYIVNLQILRWDINLLKSNLITDENREMHHKACIAKLKDPYSLNNVYTKKIKVGDELLIKKSPRIPEMPGKIINIDRKNKKVEVLFENRKVPDIVFLDKRLFKNPVSGTRSTSNQLRRSARISRNSL
jgi:hypothetical protein